MTTIDNVFQPKQTFTTAPELQTLSMPELYDTEFPMLQPIIQDLLYPGLYILAGAPKIGKSFLMAQLAYHVARGEQLWNYPVQQSGVLYLALEDKFYRLQQRLVRMFDMEVTDNLHMAVSAQDVDNGLEEQLNSFMQKYPDVRLIIIDTLQKIRSAQDEKCNYARDYSSAAKLKEFADKHNICLLLVHHTRKQQSEDSFEMISGSNGLLGAADGAMVLRKSQRGDNKASLEIVGRDLVDQLLTLSFSQAHCLWKLERAAASRFLQPPDEVLEAISAFVQQCNGHWHGTAQGLLDAMHYNKISNNSLGRRINAKKQQLLDSYNIVSNRHRRDIDLRYLPPQAQAA
ncbi:AAA family ATPase [uncultured Phascolarctobacterium sp.]|uniref:AAA family ATPase n=1 Tax=uncultured Phascolarctobacterium sp. TaxID=512296 RepID=UPI0026200D4F|nr:AAA family ATPase [uncultured Phascolarctobacterium sp.]